MLKKIWILLFLLIVGCGSAETTPVEVAVQATTTTEPTAIPPTATAEPTPTATAEPSPTPEPTLTVEPTATPEEVEEVETEEDEEADLQQEFNEALLDAVRAKDPVAAAAAIEAGADVNMADISALLSPIVSATRYGDVETFLVLYEAGADITLTDAQNNSLLHHAIGANAIDIVETLLAIEAIDIEHKRTQWEFTPLHLAAYEGKLDILNLLIEAGADVEARDEGYDTPLNVAVWGNRLEIVQRLVELGVETNAANEYDANALDIARNQGYTEIVEYLEPILAESTD